MPVSRLSIFTKTKNVPLKIKNKKEGSRSGKLNQEETEEKQINSSVLLLRSFSLESYTQRIHWSLIKDLLDLFASLLVPSLVKVMTCLIC